MDAKRHLHNFGPYSSTYTNPIALWAEKWYVRVISITLIALLFAVMVVAYPLLIVIGLPIDIYRYKKLHGLVCCRVATFFLIYFTISLIGMLGFLLLYLLKLVTFPSNKRWLEWNYAWQTVWGKYFFFKCCTAALGLKPVVEMPKEGLGEGPKILFLRHASFADTLLPQGLFSGEYQMRYVVKKELTWDPALNIGGFRTPNFFLFREAGQGGIDIEMDAIRNLVRDMTPNLPAIVSLWPEGTRFTYKKRERVLESLQKKDPKLYETAKDLKHTLLPRLGGALALLDANPCADVLFCAHMGLEGASELKEVLKGKICNSQVKVKILRVKYQDIPKTKEERIQWIYQHWQGIDKWIAQHNENNNTKTNNKRE